MRNKTHTVNFFSPAPSQVVPTLFISFSFPLGLSHRACKSSRGRLLSHMLNLVTLPTGLYYARGLILIFRMAAMATRPSSTLISTFLSFAFRHGSRRRGRRLENTHSSRNFHELVSDAIYRKPDIGSCRNRESFKEAGSIYAFYIYRLVFVNTRYFCAVHLTGDERSYDLLVVKEINP